MGVLDHEDIFTQNFHNMKICRSTVHVLLVMWDRTKYLETSTGMFTFNLENNRANRPQINTAATSRKSGYV